MIPTLRPIKVNHHRGKVAAKLVIPTKHFSKESPDRDFINKAVMASIFLHVIIFVVKLPSMVAPHEEKKEKLASIKMDFITPPESYKKLKQKIAQQDLQKIETMTDPGVKKVTTNEVGPTGDPNALPNQKVQKSKAGSAKAGPLSTPNAVGATGLGDSAAKGYEFKGKGLKALMGNSATMTIAAGAGTEGSRGLTAGTGIGNKGSNLTGDYRAPAGIGDGSGLGGKDAVGNYDRSTSTKGLANKKGIDTAFVQADTVVMGSIEPEVLRKILQEYLPQFKFCYQQELQEHSEKIKGIVDLNFRIEGDGKVSTVNIKTAQTQFSPKGISCMSNILRIIDFPKPKGGGLVDVRQPLNFFSESTKI